jgi:hypothetical protein
MQAMPEEDRLRMGRRARDRILAQHSCAMSGSRI